MNTSKPPDHDDALDYPAYVCDLLYTLIFVFQKIIPTDTLLQWLRPMIMDDDQRSMLMHEEPVYVAADFLGVNRNSVEFRQFESQYFEFQKNFLSGQNPALTHSMERTLNRLLLKANMHSRSVQPSPDLRPMSKHFSASQRALRAQRPALRTHRGFSDASRSPGHTELPLPRLRKDTSSHKEETPRRPRWPTHSDRRLNPKYIPDEMDVS
jgi:hypothetical protein